MLQRDQAQRRALINAALKALGKARAKGLREFAEWLVNCARKVSRRVSLTPKGEA